MAQYPKHENFYVAVDFPLCYLTLEGGVSALLYVGLGLVAVGMVITFVGLGDKVSQFRNSTSQRSSFRILDFGISETSYKEYQFWNYKSYRQVTRSQNFERAGA